MVAHIQLLRLHSRRIPEAFIGPAVKAFAGQVRRPSLREPPGIRAAMLSAANTAAMRLGDVVLWCGSDIRASFFAIAIMKRGLQRPAAVPPRAGECRYPAELSVMSRETPRVCLVSHAAYRAAQALVGSRPRPGFPGRSAARAHAFNQLPLSPLLIPGRGETHLRPSRFRCSVGACEAPPLGDLASSASSLLTRGGNYSWKITLAGEKAFE